MTYTNSDQIGEVTEIKGAATIIRADGSEEQATLGSPIFQGDIVETSGDGAVNIGFIDESSFAVSSDARIAIDEFVFDPASEAGAQDFSVTRGVFMYTSGLIGRENPDSVEIETPVGSIGIRGTIIGGHINPSGESSISVIEGAIVVRNEGGEQLLTNQFDTVTLLNAQTAPSNVQSMNVSHIANQYGSVKDVSTTLFSAFDDQMKQEGASQNLDEKSVEEPVEDQPVEEEKASEAPQEQSVIEIEAPTNLNMINVPLSSNTSNLLEPEQKPLPTSLEKQFEPRNQLSISVEPTTQKEFIRPQSQLKIVSINSIDEANGSTPFSGSNIVVGQVLMSNATNVTYSIVNSSVQPQFSISATGEIIFNGSHYRSLEENGFFNLHIRATNNDTGQSAQQNIRIELNDVNELAHIKIALQDDFNPNDSNIDGVIARGVDGAIIGKLAIMDPEQQNFDLDDFQIIGSAFGEQAANFFEIQEISNEFFLALKSDYQIIELAGVQRISEDGLSPISGTTSMLLDAQINIGINLGAESFPYNLSLKSAEVTNITGNSLTTITPLQNVVIGDGDNNNFKITDDEFIYLNGKDGYDKLTLQSSIHEKNFDFSNTNTMRADLSSIEKIVFGDNNDTLTMDVNTLITLLKTSDSRNSGKGELIISSNGTGTDINGITFENANNDDKNLTELGFTQIANKQIDGNTYHQFQHTDFGTVVIEAQINGASTGGL